MVPYKNKITMIYTFKLSILLKTFQFNNTIYLIILNFPLGGKAPAIKYIPLPHHDLPVLIYTSDNNPPIHVVHTPRPAVQQPSYDEPRKKVYQVTYILGLCMICSEIRDLSKYINMPN